MSFSCISYFFLFIPPKKIFLILHILYFHIFHNPPPKKRKTKHTIFRTGFRSGAFPRVFPSEGVTFHEGTGPSPGSEANLANEKFLSNMVVGWLGRDSM